MFSRVFLLNFPIKHTKNTQTVWENLIFGGIYGNEMGKGWKKIYKSTEEKNKYRVDLYYGRDSNNKIKKSSKVVYGTLTEARKQLALHEAGLARGEIKAPAKITIQQLIDDWNRLVGDVKNTETTQTSTRKSNRKYAEQLFEESIYMG